jgi:hypothetical protein
MRARCHDDYGYEKEPGAAHSSQLASPLIQFPRERRASSMPPAAVTSSGLSSEIRARSSVRSASVSDRGLPSRVA